MNFVYSYLCARSRQHGPDGIAKVMTQAIVESFEVWLLGAAVWQLEYEAPMVPLLRDQRKQFRSNPARSVTFKSKVKT
jgi:hypothetical protein